MRVVVLATDLMMVSRIHAAADAARAGFERVTDPADLPPAGKVDLLLVDWSERSDGWADALRMWCAGAPVRIQLFGRHTDLEGHRSARDLSLGPMMARSRLLTQLPSLMNT